MLQHDGEAEPVGQDQKVRHLPQHHRGSAQVRPGARVTQTIYHDHTQDGSLQQNFLPSGFHSDELCVLVYCPNLIRIENTRCPPKNAPLC